MFRGLPRRAAVVTSVATVLVGALMVVVPPSAIARPLMDDVSASASTGTEISATHGDSAMMVIDPVHQTVFVSVPLDNTIVVLDYDGNIVDEIVADHPIGMLLSASDDTLYVAELSGIAVIDTGTLTQTSTIDPPPDWCPAWLTIAGNRLWAAMSTCDHVHSAVFSTALSGTPDFVNSGVSLSEPVDLGSPSPTSSVLVMASVQTNPALLASFAINGSGLTEISGTSDYPNEIAQLSFTADGSMLYTVCDSVPGDSSPYNHYSICGYQMPNVVTPVSVHTLSTYTTYAAAGVPTPDGKYLIAAGTDLYPTAILTWPLDSDATPTEVVVDPVDTGLLAVTPDGSRVFAVESPNVGGLLTGDWFHVYAGPEPASTTPPAPPPSGSNPSPGTSPSGSNSPPATTSPASTSTGTPSPGCSASLAASVVGMAATADGDGYWIASADGRVAACGSAPILGDVTSPDARISGIAAAPTGDGYWLTTTTGTVYAFGSATYQGGLPPSLRLAAPIVGIAADSGTGGYWLLGGDGGVFAFDAPFLGSTGGMRLNQPVVGMVAADGGDGYYLVARDGGVFAFGRAPFRGSAANLHLAGPIVAMSADLATGGYWLVGSDGGIFSYGAPFYGSTGGLHLAAPVMGMSADGGGGGYRLVASDGGVFDFGALLYEGSVV